MGKKMSKAPVYFTIAQLRFNPIIRIASYVPDIQDRMRKAGYSDFRAGQSVVFNLALPDASASGAASTQPVMKTDRFTFLTREALSGFIVDQNALTFQTTNYDTFESFSQTFFDGLEIVHNCISIDYSERLGLRYLDAVDPSGGEADLKNYVASGILGLAGRLPPGEGIALTLSETHIPFPDGKLLTRTITRNGKLGFPMDLAPEGLQILDRFKKINGVHAIIDTDASYESRKAFDLSFLKDRLVFLHTKVRMAFDATVTDHAMKQWQ